MNDLKHIFIEYNFIDFESYELNIDYNEKYSNIDKIHINSILFNNLKENYVYFFTNYFTDVEKIITIHDYQWIFPDNPNISKELFFKKLYLNNFDIKVIDKLKFLFKICTKIIFPTNNIYNNYSNFIDFSYFSDKIFIINHSDKIINNNYLYIPIVDEIINISFVGNFYKYKGSEFFINLSNKFNYYKNKKLQFHIFGIIDDNQSLLHNIHKNIIIHYNYDDNQIKCVFFR